MTSPKTTGYGTNGLVNVTTFTIPQTYDITEVQSILKKSIPDSPIEIPKSMGFQRWGQLLSDAYLEEANRVRRKGLEESLMSVAKDADICSLDRSIGELPLLVDPTGYVWNVRSVALLYVPCIESISPSIYARQVRSIALGIGKERLGRPLMLTQLLVALASSTELREFVREKMVVALGHESSGDVRFPAVIYPPMGSGVLSLYRECVTSSALFAFNSL